MFPTVGGIGVRVIGCGSRVGLVPVTGFLVRGV